MGEWCRTWWLTLPSRVERTAPRPREPRTTRSWWPSVIWWISAIRMGCSVSIVVTGRSSGIWSRASRSTASLSSGPRRITELAELERLAQPTLTQLVQRLEQQGFVNRERQTDDGRVVLVRLTEAGAAALDEFRCRASAALGAHLVELPDAEIESLAAATETMGRLVALLQQGR